MNKQPNQSNDGQSPDKSVQECRRQPDRRNVAEILIDQWVDSYMPLYDQFLRHTLRVLGRPAAEKYLRRAWAKGRQGAHAFLVRNHPSWGFKKIKPEDLPENPLEFTNPDVPAMAKAKCLDDVRTWLGLTPEEVASPPRSTSPDGQPTNRPPC